MAGGVIAGHRVKLCRGHLQACTLLWSTVGLYWNEKRFKVIGEEPHGAGPLDGNQSGPYLLSCSMGADLDESINVLW